MNKKIIKILGGSIIIIGFLSLVCVVSIPKDNSEKENKTETAIIDKDSNDTDKEDIKDVEVEENKIEDKFVADDEVTEEDFDFKNDNYNNIDDAVEFITPIIEDSFGSLDYDIVKKEDIIFLVCDISKYEILTCSDEIWNGLKENSEYACKNIKELLDLNGYNDISFGILVGDKDLDEFFLSVLDGYTIKDLR